VGGAVGPPDTATAPGTFAFRMFRNLDGHGAGFGTTSLPATSADQAKIAAYAAARPDGTLTAVVVNKSTTDLTSPVTVVGATLGQTGTRYQYSAAAPQPSSPPRSTPRRSAPSPSRGLDHHARAAQALPGPALTLRTSSSSVTYPGT